MATYIFAIGGTGARVMRSFTMLMAAGINNLDNTELIYPIIIDYDKENGDKLRTIESMKHYTEVHNLVMNAKLGLDQTLVQNKPFFTAEYRDLLNNDWCWNFNLEENQSKFEDYIAYNEMGRRSVESQHLIDSLYDTSNDETYTELKLKMDIGFQGNPNIGSAVFNELKNNDEFIRFTDEFRQGDKIVIVGSLFGGTGASGIPKIISAIRHCGNNHIESANISVVFVMPYFAIDVNGESSIKSAIFNSKTKAALNYYEQSGVNKEIDNIYYIGDKVPTRVQPCIGGEQQRNIAHFVEMIAAMAIAHTITVPHVERSGNRYKFNASQNITDGIGIDELLGSPNQWADNPFVTNIVHNLINLVLASRFFLDRILDPSKDNVSNSSFFTDLKLGDRDLRSKSQDCYKVQDYCAAVYNFICKELNTKENKYDDGLWQWLKELHDKAHDTHRLKIFKLDCTDICDVIDGKELRSYNKPFFGNPRKKPLLTYGMFVSEMNNNITPYNSGIYRIEKLNKDTYPWILNDILHKMAEEIRKHNSDLVQKFNLIP